MRETRFTDLVGIRVPIIQAPMAGSSDAELAIAVSNAEGLGSVPCAMLTPLQVRESWQTLRKATTRPVNLNFFCHAVPRIDSIRERHWRESLAAFYTELGIDVNTSGTLPNRTPFDGMMCEVVEELKPDVVSFHFGLPAKPMLERVRRTGAVILSSATTVAEARWLEDAGCDAVIAQGSEAGGHRGMFLTADVAGQVGIMALLPQIVDAVKVPVIASGGIADARGIVASFALGASAVQIGTAYLRCPECRTTPLHRKSIETAREDQTVITNIFTGRPARGVINRFIRECGPLSAAAPEFPRAAEALAPLRAKAEESGSADFSPLWCGQAVRLGTAMPAAELTRQMYQEALALAANLVTPLR
jgi:nitronate monooxygenase